LDKLIKFTYEMKFLLYEIIPRAGFNLATGRFWPASRMFDTPTLHFQTATMDLQHNRHVDKCISKSAFCSPVKTRDGM